MRHGLLLVVLGLVIWPAWLSASRTSAGAENLLLVANRPQAGPYFDEALSEKARRVPGVEKVGNLLIVKRRPHDILGVEPGAPLRIIIGDRVVTVNVIEGRNFRAVDIGNRVAIAGRATAIEDYQPGADAMSGMRHGFEIGSSFALRGSTVRLRVIGIYAGGPEDKVFVPLTTAQKLLKLEGKLSHLVIAVRSGSEPREVARTLQATLGQKVAVVLVR